jgi:hypothetical protein
VCDWGQADMRRLERGGGPVGLVLGQDGPNFAWRQGLVGESTRFGGRIRKPVLHSQGEVNEGVAGF